MPSAGALDPESPGGDRISPQGQQQVEQAGDIIRLGLTDTQQKSPVEGEPAGLPFEFVLPR